MFRQREERTLGKRSRLASEQSTFNPHYDLIEQMQNYETIGDYEAAWNLVPHWIEVSGIGKDAYDDWVFSPWQEIEPGRPWRGRRRDMRPREEWGRATDFTTIAIEHNVYLRALHAERLPSFLFGEEQNRLRKSRPPLGDE